MYYSALLATTITGLHNYQCNPSVEVLHKVAWRWRAGPQELSHHMDIITLRGLVDVGPQPQFVAFNPSALLISPPDSEGHGNITSPVCSAPNLSPG